MADDYNPLSSSWNAYNRVDSCEVEVNVSTHELGAETTGLLFFAVYYVWSNFSQNTLFDAFY